MSAGLPGLGLGGLFFILSALLAPIVELGRTLQGRSSLSAWKGVGRQFAQAAAMIVAVDLALRLLYLALGATSSDGESSAGGTTALPIAPILITAGLLTAVLGLAKFAEVALRIRSAGLPALPASLPRPSPWRALATGGAATVAFFALLAFGASELSTIPDRDGGSGVDRAIGASVAPGSSSSGAVGDAPRGPSSRAVEGVVSGVPSATTLALAEPGTSPGEPVPDRTTATSETTPASVTETAVGTGTSEDSTGGTSPNVTLPDDGGGTISQGSSAQGGPPDTAGPPLSSKAPDHAGPSDTAGPAARG